jgi:twitching motility protein PilI
MTGDAKLSLRDFQNQLAERLKQAGNQPSSASKLGFIAGGRHWLTELQQINEVVTVPELTPVFWAKPWFAGVASVRGAIYGCTDLGAFFDLTPPIEGDECRMLLVHPRYGVNAALRIEQPLGLRSIAGMQAVDRDPDQGGAVIGRWLDPDGTDWTEIDMERLVTDPKFLLAGT